MEIFNRDNSKNTGKLEILTSHMLISPQSSSSGNLSIQISEVPVGSEQPVHAHEPEQCYYVIRGKGLMIVEDESREVTAGDAVYIPPGKKHGIKNTGNEVLEYLSANSPCFAKEYEDRFWPVNSEKGLEIIKMINERNNPEETDKKLAAVCGLYCKACSLFIATTEDPARLKIMAARFQMPEDEVKCYGCRADKRGPYCRICKMFDCATQKGIDFCVECEEYPCEGLKEFQSAMPHRNELFKDLDRIRTIGWENWIKEIRENYACHKCGTINSAYDIKCRKCGEEPGCDYSAKHNEAINKHLKKIHLP